MSSQDFPGPSWQDRPASDDWRSGYRPVSEDSYRQPNAAPLNQHGGPGRDNGYGSSGYGRTNGSQGQPNGNGSAGRGGGSGSGSYGNGYGSGLAGNGAGDRSVPGGRKVATGRHGGRRAGQDDGVVAGEDTGSWYRPVGRSGSPGTSTWRSVTSRRPGRSGYDDARTGVGTRTGRYGPGGPYGPGGAGGPGRPGGGRRDPRRGDRDMRALIDPDGQTPLPLKILRRLWYGRWWRHWSFKKVGLLFGALCATMALALVATFFVALHSTKVPIRALETAGSNSSSLVYFSNDKVVGCFCTAGRFPLSQTQIQNSKHLVAAVLAAEDRAFFTEGGISVTGLLRALKNNLSGGSIQGGSTITEQFVKTYYDQSLIGHPTLTTKIKEIFVSIKLAQMEPKMWILTHYLNAIPLGSGANGVEAAAQTYFHVHAWQLTVAQAAMIAAMIQNPSGYDPQNPTAIVPDLGNSLLQRWIYVLTNMVRDGAITQARFNGLVPDQNPADTNAKVNLKKFPKLRTSSLQSNWPGFRGYIMNLVANELDANYGLHVSTTQLGNLGLQIHTTINERLMYALATAINQEKAQMAAEGVPMPSYVNISAVLEKPGTGKILAFYGGPGFLSNAKRCKRLHCSFNTILAAEQVGSSFKPYVLATAIGQGMNVRTSVMNSHAPLCIPPDYHQYRMMLSKQTKNCQAGFWPFTETSENFHQNLTPWEAMSVSNDPTFEDLIHRTGVQNVINMAQRLGVSKSTIQGLNAEFGDNCQTHYPHCFPGAVSAALGQGQLTAVDQANTFAVLVSDGRLVTPHLISSVTQNGVPLIGHLVRKQHAIPSAVAADTDFGLSFDTQSTTAGAGTGVPNAVWNRPMIAKTGTLGQNTVATEAWFIGAIPQYSLSVGMFTDRPGGSHPQILDVLPSANGIGGSYGGAWPASIWHRFMVDQFNNLPVEQLPPLTLTGTDPVFKKWVLAPPVKKRKRCRLFLGGGGGPGGGNGGGGGGGGGNGHHHVMVIMSGGGQGNRQCKGGPLPTNSPSPNPTSPSPNPTSPSPSPTVTVTLPPSQSPSPSGSPSTSPPGPLAAPHRQRVPNRTANTASLSAFAILPNQLTRKAAWVVTSTSV